MSRRRSRRGKEKDDDLLCGGCFFLWCCCTFCLFLIKVFFLQDGGGIGCKTRATGERNPKVDEAEKKRWRRFTVKTKFGDELRRLWDGAGVERRLLKVSLLLYYWWLIFAGVRTDVNLLFCLCFAETVEADDVKELLPERLFATDRFPNKRVNTTDYLSRVRNALNNTLEMAKLIGSCFEGSSSCQHRGCWWGNLFIAWWLGKSFVRKTYEMWLVFGRKPLRFPLVGFREGWDCRAGSLKMVITSIFTYPIRMKTMSIRID